MEEVTVKELLKYEFTKRKLVNSRYSLRSFARFLEMDPSLLSKVLNSKRKLSIESQKKCYKKLNFSPSQLKNHDLGSFLTVTQDEFKFLSDPTFYTILELLKLPKFKKNIDKLSLKLGLDKTEVKTKLNTLEKLGYIKITKSSIQLLRPDNSWVDNKTTTYLKKEFQKSIITINRNCIDTVDFLERDNSSLTVLANRDQLEEIKYEIKKFRRRVDKILDEQKDRNDVYHLTVGFVPVTEKGI